jgi:hypothetical protein
MDNIVIVRDLKQVLDNRKQSDLYTTKIQQNTPKQRKVFDYKTVPIVRRRKKEIYKQWLDRNKKERPVVEIENLGVKKLLNLKLKEKYNEMISAIFIPENRKVNLNEVSDKWLDTPNERIGGIPPRDFLDTEKEWVIVDLIQNIEQGYPI